MELSRASTPALATSAAAVVAASVFLFVRRQRRKSRGGGGGPLSFAEAETSGSLVGHGGDDVTFHLFLPMGTTVGAAAGRQRRGSNGSKGGLKGQPLKGRHGVVLLCDAGGVGEEPTRDFCRRLADEVSQSRVRARRRHHAF